MIFETHCPSSHANAIMPLLSAIATRFLPRRRALNEPTSKLAKLSPADALLHYSTPGVAPPSARIDPKLKLAARRPPRVWEYWKFAAVAASKGIFASPIPETLLSGRSVHSDPCHLRGPLAHDLGAEAEDLGH